MDELEKLIQQWAHNKEQERFYIEARRETEEEIKELLEINENEIKSHNYGNLKIEVRHSHKVDAEILKEVVSDLDRHDLLDDVFKWKAEINTRNFEKLDATTRLALSRAITTKPNRPSFKIKDEKNA